MVRRVIAWLAVGIGVALVVAAPALFPHAGQSPCHVAVERVGATPADATVRQYADLGATARGAVDAALASPDGDVTVYGDRCPEWFADADAPSRYYVERGDAVYRVRTRVGSAGAFPGDLSLCWALALAGGATALVGARALDADAPLAAATSGGAATVALLAVGTASGATVLAAMGGALVVSCPALGATLDDRSPSTVGALLVGAVFAWFLAVDDGVGPHFPDAMAAVLAAVAVSLVVAGRRGADAFGA